MLEKQVDLEICRIPYWEGGLALTPNSVLFLPGWGVSVETYLESLKALSERYLVIAADLPGFSKSTSPGTLQDYGDYANCLIAFLEKLKFEKFHLIGHSIGGAKRSLLQ